MPSAEGSQHRLTTAQPRGDAAFELVNIIDFNLPLLDEPVPPFIGQYSQPLTKAWAAKIEAFDAHVFVTPEYNHGTWGALKNALISSTANGITRPPASYHEKSVNDELDQVIAWGGALKALREKSA
jgi:hypothetical protein